MSAFWRSVGSVAQCLWLRWFGQRFSPPYDRRPRLTVELRQAWMKPAAAKHSFDVLAPRLETTTKNLRYQTELLGALTDPRVRNVAITGGYGAGKSSLIHSFVHAHREYNYAFISLALFGERGKQDPGGSAPEEIERVETTIVQQLLYSVPSSAVPGSRLERIAHASKISAIALALVSVVAILLAVALVGKNALGRLSGIYPDFVLEDGHRPLAYVLLYSTLVLAIYLSIRWMQRRRVRSINLSGLSLESDKESSALHKNVDEIVYLFERKKIDIVFIEDIDRFDDQSIFARLREINFIINSSRRIDGVVRFVFALKDELFDSGDRTKFFDVVIPIVPLLNSENSKEYLQSTLDARAQLRSCMYGLSRGLIDSVSSYFPNMRSVMNLANEFDLYHNQLSADIPLNSDKLFAVVALKCLYPVEYSLLQAQGGPIHEAVELPNAWKGTEVEALRTQLEEMTLRLAEVDGEILPRVRELRILLREAVIDKSGVIRASHFTLQNNIIERSEFAEDAIFEQLVNAESATQVVAESGHRKSVSVSSVFNTGTPSIRERIERITDLKPQLEAKVEEVRAEIARVGQLNMSELIAIRKCSDRVQKFCSLNRIPAVAMLIQRGVLAADYMDYCGYFYPGSLTVSDKSVLLRLREGGSVDPRIQLSAPEKVLEQLSPSELKGGRGFIVSFATVLGSSAWKSRVPRYLKEIFTNLDDDSLERLDAVLYEVSGTEASNVMIDFMVKDQPELVASIFLWGTACTSPEVRGRLVARVVETADPLKKNGELISSGGFRQVLSSEYDYSFLAALSPATSTARRWFSPPAAKIRSIASCRDVKVLDALLRIHAVLPSRENLQVLVDVYFPNGVAHSGNPLDRLLADEDGVVVRYLKANVSALVSAWGDGPSPSVSEEAFIKILNSASLEPSLIERVVSTFSAHVVKLESVSASARMQLWASGKVLRSVANFCLMLESLEGDASTLVMPIVESEQGQKEFVESVRERGDTSEVREALKAMSATSSPPNDLIATAAGSAGVCEWMLTSDWASDDLCMEIIGKYPEIVTADTLSSMSMRGEDALNRTVEAIGSSRLSMLLKTLHLSDDRWRELVKNPYFAFDPDGGVPMVLHAACVGDDVASTAAYMGKLAAQGGDFIRKSLTREMIGVLSNAEVSEDVLLEFLGAAIHRSNWKGLRPALSKLVSSGFSALNENRRSFEVDAMASTALLDALVREGLLEISELRGNRILVKTRLAKQRRKGQL